MELQLRQGSLVEDLVLSTDKQSCLTSVVEELSLVLRRLDKAPALSALKQFPHTAHLDISMHPF